MSVLIAEDNRDFAEMLKISLEAAGYKVHLAANGREAVEVQRKTPARILVTDLVMPESDGFEAIDTFRREFPATRVVVVSGTQKLDTQRYLDAAKLMGADATLRKPFKVEELLETLKRF
jgi:CheY-like chemotaxis protein